jgi:two-component system sensor histidine kinase PhoQ
MQSPTVTLIYDAKGKLLWAQRDVPGWQNAFNRNG